MREKLFHRDFTLVVIGQIISLLGNAVLRFVLPLYLLDVTGSRSLFGLCSAAAFVPMVVLTPLGGVVADRLHKQRIMVVLDFFTCALVALTALALGHLPLVPVLVAAMMLLYGISGAYQPAVQASMPLLCPPDRLVDGNAVINQVSALSSLLGPLLGSLVYGTFGVTPVLAGASACFFASAVMELFIQIPHTPRHTRASVWQTARADLAESGTFLWQERPEILKYIALVSAFNLLLSALLVVSMPVLIKQTLVLGDTWYYVTALEESEAQTLQESGRLKLRFAKGVGRDLSVKLTHISEAEGGRVVAVFQGDTYLSELTLLRQQSAEVIRQTTTGIRVPKEALRVRERTVTDEDGNESVVSETGVYCMVGMKARFKPVDVLYSGDDFALVRSTLDTAEEVSKTQEQIRLRAGDEVIITAYDLYDGKVIGS